MVMHPNDPDTLIIGTGEGFFEAPEGSSNTAFVRGAGIFVSTDAGATWNQLPSTDNPDFYFVNRLAFDPSDSNIMLAATLTGIWRTTDAGATWTLQQAFEAMDVKFDPNNPLQVLAGGHDIPGDSPFYSTDGGVTWQQANGADGHRQEFAWAPSQPNTVYAGVSDGGRIKVWRSTDGGQNYTLQTTGNGISTLASYNNTIWVDPTDPNFLVIGGVRLFKSTDAGVTFAQSFNSVHADMHRIVPHPGFDGTTNTTVYFATDGGIYRSDDVYGSGATGLNNNLGVTQFYGGGINPTTGDIVGGTQDNGTLFYSGDPQDWFHLFGGDGGYGAADPTDPNFFYGEVQRALIHRSTDGGASASYIYNGPNPIQDAGSSATVNFIPFFVLDPNDPNRMLVACERMWRSNNVKAAQPDWFPMKDSIEPPPGGFGLADEKIPQSHYNPNSPWNLSTIAVAEGNSDIIWGAHNNGQLFFTTNGTDANPVWTRVDENGVGLPDRWISTVVIDRNDHSHVYVALMGWEGDNLWETTDSGLTWTDITGVGLNSIPDAPISALAIHRNIAGWLYVGTDVGVFTSSDNGTTWSTNSEGPSNAPVEQLLWKDDDELLAVTHGRGMFIADVQALSLDFDFPNGQPLIIDPAGGTTMRVEVLDNGAVPQSGTGMLHVDTGGGFVAIPMNEVSPNIYDAVFPSSNCGSIVKYYVSAQSQLAGQFFDPSGAPANFFTAISAAQLNTTFIDDFEADLGWTVSGDATDGQWDRGVPIGGGDRGDPPTDADGSGSCYLTDNEDGNSDVDGGSTILTSPLLDGIGAGGGEAILSYYRWYSNHTGNAPEADIFVVEISNDGGSTWTNLETVGPTGVEVRGGWFFKQFKVSDFVVPTNQMRIRFTASDLADGSVVEAGVDGLLLQVADCENQTVPESHKLSDGVLAGGSLADVFASDDVYMELDPTPTKNLLKQTIHLILQSTSPSTSPGNFQFRFESSMVGGPSGDVIQTIELFNYSTNTFELLDTRAVANTDESILISPGGDLSRFVQSGTDEITASIKWKSESFSGTPFTWSVDVDEAVLLISN